MGLNGSYGISDLSLPSNLWRDEAVPIPDEEKTFLMRIRTNLDDNAIRKPRYRLTMTLSARDLLRNHKELGAAADLG